MFKKLVVGAVMAAVPVLGVAAPASADTASADRPEIVKVVKDLPRGGGIAVPARLIDWH